MSTALLVLPDAERVLVDFLRAQPELREALDDRVYTELPARPAWPAVRVVRWGGWAAISEPLVLDEAWCQVDTWGERKAQVSDVVMLMRAVISDRLKRQAADVCSGFRLGMLIDNPDATFVPARPHFRFDMSLMLRPSTASTVLLEAAAPPRSTSAPVAPARRKEAKR